MQTVGIDTLSLCHGKSFGSFYFLLHLRGEQLLIILLFFSHVVCEFWNGNNLGQMFPSQAYRYTRRISYYMYYFLCL